MLPPRPDANKVYEIGVIKTRQNTNGTNQRSGSAAAENSCEYRIRTIAGARPSIRSRPGKTSNTEISICSPTNRDIAALSSRTAESLG